VFYYKEESFRAVRLSGVKSKADMVFVPGGSFRMGSDRHYSEESPAHQVSVDGFWIDRTPVTNRQFKQFVLATGHKTFAEISPDPKNYPDALPHMLYAARWSSHLPRIPLI
jgi:formylglycine-generating enzyme